MKQSASSASPRRYANTGKSPRSNSIPLHIEWANGTISPRTHTANQLKWELRGWPFDIAYYWRADEAGEPESATLPTTMAA